jgi:ABC-type dipeptide/oligopeptide/nickel transport system ATPase component
LARLLSHHPASVSFVADAVAVVYPGVIVEIA